MTDEIFDPFAADDAVDAPAPTETKKTTTRKTTKKDTAVAENNENNTGVTATFKGGPGFEAPWIVLHEKDLPSLDAVLDDAVLLASVMNKVQDAGKTFRDAAPAAPAAQNTSTPAARQAAPEGGKMCNHGAMVFRSGVSASTGKPWKGYFCPTPRGTADQCSPEFVR